MSLSFVLEDGNGLSNAEIYVSLTEANTYHNRSLYGDTWTDTDSGQTRLKAIYLATKTIDNYFQFVGAKKNSEQALKFPRVYAISPTTGIALSQELRGRLLGASDARFGAALIRDGSFGKLLERYGDFATIVDVVPQAIKDATAELAKHLLLENRFEAAEAPIRSFSDSGLSVTLSPNYEIVPRVVRDLLEDFIRGDKLTFEVRW